jgi:hypothetical protein
LIFFKAEVSALSGHHHRLSILFDPFGITNLLPSGFRFAGPGNEQFTHDSFASGQALIFFKAGVSALSGHHHRLSILFDPFGITNLLPSGFRFAGPGINNLPMIHLLLGKLLFFSKPGFQPFLGITTGYQFSLIPSGLQISSLRDFDLLGPDHSLNPFQD